MLSLRGGGSENSILYYPKRRDLGVENELKPIEPCRTEAEKMRRLQKYVRFFNSEELGRYKESREFGELRERFWQLEPQVFLSSPQMLELRIAAGNITQAALASGALEEGYVFLARRWLENMLELGIEQIGFTYIFSILEKAAKLGEVEITRQALQLLDSKTWSEQVIVNSCVKTEGAQSLTSHTPKELIERMKHDAHLSMNRALSAAIKGGGGYVEIVQLLLERGAKPNAYHLCEALAYSNTKIVEMLLQAGADVNGKAGKTALELAAEYGSVDDVKLLLAFDIEGESGILALNQAVRSLSVLNVGFKDRLKVYRLIYNDCDRKGYFGRTGKIKQPLLTEAMFLLLIKSTGDLKMEALHQDPRFKQSPFDSLPVELYSQIFEGLDEDDRRAFKAASFASSCVEKSVVKQELETFILKMRAEALAYNLSFPEGEIDSEEKVEQLLDAYRQWLGQCLSKKKEAAVFFYHLSHLPRSYLNEHRPWIKSLIEA